MSFALSEYIPVWLVELGGYLVLAAVIIGVAYRFASWRRVLPETLVQRAKEHGAAALARHFFSVLLRRVILQRGIINDSKARLSAHHAMFWGFLLCGAATTLVFALGIAEKARTFADYPKVIGNVGGIFLLIGGTYILLRLIAREEFRRERRLGDFVFFGSLYITTITGFTTQYLRMNNLVELAVSSYVIHLASAALLLGAAPFTHFFHALLTPAMRLLEELAGGMPSLYQHKAAAITQQIEELYSEDRKE